MVLSVLVEARFALPRVSVTAPAGIDAITDTGQILGFGLSGDGYHAFMMTGLTRERLQPYWVSPDEPGGK
jgi:hypothetical protein